MANESVVFDTPEGIQFYRLLAISHRLEIEAKGMRFRINTGPVARKILTDAGRKAPRTKVDLAKAFREYIEEFYPQVKR